MMSDLFSIFDYGFGVWFIWEGSFLWSTSVFLVMLWLSFNTFWYESNNFNGFLNFFSLSVSKEMSSYQMVSYGGGVSFVLSMLIILFSMNMFGMGPYIFGISCHFAFAMSFSFSLWFSMFLFNLFTNPTILMGSFVLPDLPMVGSMIMVWIELLSNLIRALTLSLRLCLNLASGQIVMGLLGSFSNVLFVVGPSVSSVMCGFGCGVLLVMDIFIAGLQAFLFVALVVMYIDENMIS